MATLVEIKAKVGWKALRGRGGNWVAVCDPLGLTIQSGSWNEMMEDIGQTLNAMLLDLLESNDLDRFLRDRGWTLTGPIPAKRDDIRFDLPFYAVPVSERGLPRYVPQ